MVLRKFCEILGANISNIPIDACQLLQMALFQQKNKGNDQDEYFQIFNYDCDFQTCKNSATLVITDMETCDFSKRIKQLSLFAIHLLQKRSLRLLLGWHTLI